MLYAIGENKIIRADNDGNSVAEVHFKKKAEGVYDVTEVLTVSDDAEDKDLDKVMRKTVDHMRRNQNKLTTSDPFAKEWFESHAESYDVYVRPKTAGRTKTSDSASPEQTGKDAHSKKAVHESSSKKKTRKKKSDKDQNKDPKDSSKSEDLTLDDLPGNAARAFGRFLQVLCFGAMLAIGAIYAYGFYTTYNDTLSAVSGISARNTFLGASLGFVILCVLFAFWILSRKKYIVDGKKMKLDTGRGIFAFALVLIGLILSPTATAFATSTIAAQSSYAVYLEGAKAFLETFYANAQYIVVFSIGGLIASVIRQFVGR